MGISLGSGLQSGGGGASGDTLTTAPSFSALPASADLGAYARVGTTFYRYSEDNGWVPPAMYDAPALTSRVRLNARDLSLSDGAAVSSWGDHTNTLTARPTYRETGGPESGPAVEFDGTNDQLDRTVTGFDGARYIVWAGVVFADAVSNHCIWSLGSSNSLAQVYTNSQLRFFGRNASGDSGGIAVLGSAAFPTSEWGVVVGFADYEDNNALGLQGMDGDQPQAIVSPLTQEGVVAANYGATNTLSAASVTSRMGINAAENTPFNGKVAYWEVWTATEEPTAEELQALGELAWAEATG